MLKGPGKNTALVLDIITNDIVYERLALSPGPSLHRKRAWYPLFAHESNYLQISP